MAQVSTIWDRLALCVTQLDEPFRASEIVGWFRRHYPAVNEASLRSHIQSATSNVAASSKIAGFSQRQPLITRIRHGLYVRYKVETDEDRMEEAGPSGQSADLILVACSSLKADEPQAARELYRGDLFRKAKAYAQLVGQPWYVLSGKWGLVSPDDVIAPYDLYLADQSVAYRRAWGEWVAAQLELAAGPLRGRLVEMHAGQSYLEPLRGPLGRLGAVIRHPLHGLRQGEQLAWYGEHVHGSEEVEPTPTSAGTASEALVEPSKSNESTDMRVLWGPRESGPFEYRWPEGPEHFQASWQMGVESGGKVYTVRHCLGERHVYGRTRRHSVTFLNRAPEVEGVAADDYASSRSLLSPLKGTDRKLVRHVADMPAPYRAFNLVNHRAEISARYSRDAVAVKLAEDDVQGWAAYALARQAVRLGPTSSPGGAAAHGRLAPVLPTRAPGTGDQGDVVAALLELGSSGLNEEWVGPSSFTPNAAANELVTQNAFAFLLGVVFDQGISAERAWQAPYELRLRLGHLDPPRMAVEAEAVRRAIATPPMLHRFVEKMPAWIVAAAQIVTRDYGGDAEAIWAGMPTARQVQQRLDAFPGIGQKKAAMAVEILERDLGVPIREMQGSDVAYDVHVRRVFLRTGLAEVDDLDHMVDVARTAHPERPGAIDLPAWHVGRTWCRAGIPLCESCPLSAVCPKDIDAASKVRGV